MTRTAAVSARVRDTRSTVDSQPALGEWKLLRVVGEGRWSRIYRARPREFPDDRPGDYAIKVLKDSFSSSPECLEMLRREAALGREIAHPHLIAVLGSQLKRAPRFLTLPFLEGCTLEEALADDRPLPVALVLWFARQSAEALAALHQAGWIHGDVKPANLHIAPSGHLTVIDLGLAQPLRTAAAPCDRPFAGSVAYAAPETFCTAQIPTGACDVYSLGVVLFEAMTGRLPFDDEDPQKVAAAHLSQAPPDLRSLVPQIPGRVARVVRRMLAKDPLRRPGSTECIELLTALEIETFGEAAPLESML
jgi:serine/threonine-protein kinase